MCRLVMVMRKHLKSYGGLLTNLMNERETTVVNSLKNLDVHNDLEGGQGYVTARISDKDLSLFRNLINEQYLHILQVNDPTSVKAYLDKGIEHYHEVFFDGVFDHSKVWAKPSRVLGPGAVEAVFNSDLFASLKQQFGHFLVSDEEGFGWSNIYWRLVRPGYQDVGPVHADKWFWDLGHGHMPDNHYRVKLWLAIHVEAGKSGLRVVPESQKSNHWRYHGEEKSGMMKPILDEEESDLNLVNLPLDAGEYVLFHDSLLHGGMPNLSSSSRVSLEFTLIVPE